MARRRKLDVDLEKIEIYKEMIDYCKERGDAVHQQYYEEKLAQTKHDYRQRLKEKNAKKYVFNGEIVNEGGDWDYSWYKVFFPHEKWTDEEKDEFRAAVWKPYKPTYYDCTGQIFTRFVDVFNVPNGVVAYIWEAMDV